MAYRVGFKLPRVVPWSTWAEWVDVYHWLFSTDIAQRALGVERVKAWASRGKVPLAVEVTASLVEIALHDIFPPMRSASELRLLYSMAIVRFVNGLVEREQGAQAKSVAVLAESLNLPRVLVDLRHSATHKILPSLPTLRQACVTSLTWLNESYWSKQESQLIDVKSVVFYRLSRYQSVQFESPNTASTSKSLAKCLKKIIQKVSVNHVTTVLIPYLLDFIIPDNPRSVKEHLEGWLLAIERFVAEWPQFLPALLVVLVDQLAIEVAKSQAEEEQRRRDHKEFYVPSPTGYHVGLISKWLKYFLTTRRYLRVLRNSPIEMPFPLLLEGILRLPHKSAVSVARKMMPLIHLKKGFRVKLKQLTDLHPDSMAQSGKKRKRVPDTEGLDLDMLSRSFAEYKRQEAIHKVQDAGRSAASAKRHRTGRGNEEEGWALCEYWKMTPLGMLKHRTFPDLQLPPSLDKMCGARYLVPKVEPVPMMMQQVQPEHTEAAPNVPYSHYATRRDKHEDEDATTAGAGDARESSEEAGADDEVARRADGEETSVNLLLPLEDLLSL